ncbi:MAG: hypothetical protein O2945_04455 [Planctomycetota bacterium]|nr:hypothetical protein [Planctomycetota bacterium]MDA0918308.1 hypothetical protein [Planctomycetota bacterium]
MVLARDQAVAERDKTGRNQHTRLSGYRRFINNSSYDTLWMQQFAARQARSDEIPLRTDGNDASFDPQPQAQAFALVASNTKNACACGYGSNTSIFTE